MSEQVSVSARVLPLVERVPYLVELGDKDPLTAKKRAETAIRWLDNIDPTSPKEVQILHLAKEAFRSIILRYEIVVSSYLI